jgi:uncharacterized membrane protein (DUF106 family)
MALSEFAIIPVSTLVIMLISIGIAFMNGGINRILISRLVGWEDYRRMQKETTEFRSQMMQATRANDKKQVEKLKRKESQIMNMQKKMMKPQLVNFGVSFLYIFIWIFVLTPTFGADFVAYIPGIGSITVFYWYPICSLLFGTLSSRAMGTMPIE